MRVLATSLTSAALLLSLAGSPALAQEAAGDSACRLMITGELVEHLTLQNSRGAMLEFDRPGRTLTLPAGQYHLREVLVEGGYQCSMYGFEEESFTLTPDEPHSLNVGAPLKPHVEVKRWGTSLRMEYQLLDEGDRQYVCQDYTNQPKVAIYQGDEEIGSGTFRYG